jgi:hypothetical protein
MPLSMVVPKLISGQLDANGNMTATAIGNDALINASGQNTTYQLTIKDAGGGQVWNETYFFTGAAANLNVVLPSGSTIPIFIPQGIGTDTTVQVSTSGAFTMPSSWNLVIEATAGAGGITLTMPSAIGLGGRKITIVQVDTGVGGVQINPFPASGQTFSGRSGFELTNQWQTYTIASDNANWIITATFG